MHYHTERNLQGLGNELITPVLVLALFAVGNVYVSLCKKGAYAPVLCQNSDSHGIPKRRPTALGPVANTDTKLLIYGLFQKSRILAQDGRAGTFRIRGGPGHASETSRIRWALLGAGWLRQ